MANKYDSIKTQNIIPIKQGSTYIDTITCTQPDGSPMDLKDCTFRSQLRALDDTMILDETKFTSAPVPDELIDGVLTPTGKIAREISAAYTSDIPLPNPVTKVIYVWGVEITTGTGKVLPEIQGGATVSPQVVV